MEKPLRKLLKTEFAELCGVSRAAITQAVGDGRLHESGKLIDLQHPSNADYLRGKQGDVAGALQRLRVSMKEKADAKPAPTSKKTGGKKATPKAKKAAAKKPAKEPAKKKGDSGKKTRQAAKLKDGVTRSTAKGKTDDGDMAVYYADMTVEELAQLPPSVLGKAETERIKSFWQSQDVRLKVEERRGKLISRKLVKLVFARLHTVDTTELKAMEDRLAAGICAIFGEAEDSSEGMQVRKLMNGEIVKSLRHVKRIIGEYLEDQKAVA